jgi:four helix bundle protein
VIFAAAQDCNLNSGARVEKKFNHEKLDVYQHSLGFVGWEHACTSTISFRIAAMDQFDRAAASIPTNIVIGNSKESPKERIRSFDDAYGSMLECAACLDVLQRHGPITQEKVDEGKRMLSRLVSMVIGLRRAQAGRVMEERAEYSTEGEATSKNWFDHEGLDVYQLSLRYIEWFVELSRSCEIPAKRFHDLDRSSTGMPLNIAEGNGKFTMRNRCKFLAYAETHTLCCAKELDLLVVTEVLKPEAVANGKKMLYRIESMVRGLRRSLRNRKREG